MKKRRTLRSIMRQAQRCGLQNVKKQCEFKLLKQATEIDNRI